MPYRVNTSDTWSVAYAIWRAVTGDSKVPTDHKALWTNATFNPDFGKLITSGSEFGKSITSGSKQRLVSHIENRRKELFMRLISECLYTRASTRPTIRVLGAHLFDMAMGERVLVALLLKKVVQDSTKILAHVNACLRELEDQAQPYKRVQDDSHKALGQEGSGAFGEYRIEQYFLLRRQWIRVLVHKPKRQKVADRIPTLFYDRSDQAFSKMPGLHPNRLLLTWPPRMEQEYSQKAPKISRPLFPAVIRTLRRTQDQDHHPNPGSSHSHHAGPDPNRSGDAVPDPNSSGDAPPHSRIRAARKSVHPYGKRPPTAGRSKADPSSPGPSNAGTSYVGPSTRSRTRQARSNAGPSSPGPSSPGPSKPKPRK